MANGPLIVQSDRTVLLEVAHPDAESARHELAVFAELERAPEHIHTYRVTRLGLWNARAAGHDADDMLATLDRWSKFPVPPSVALDIAETVRRYGRLVIERDDEGSLGIVLGGSGNGEQMAANKVKGIRAALCLTPEFAALAREHNGAQILSIGGRFVSVDQAKEIARTFIATEFSGVERHARRIAMVEAYEHDGTLPPQSVNRP